MTALERQIGYFAILGVFLAWGLWGELSAGLPLSLQEVARGLHVLARDGVLLRDVLASMARVVIGVGLALLVALILAMSFVVHRSCYFALSGVIELFRPVPPIAWIPIVIMLFGVGDKPAIAIVFLGAFFPIWLGLQQGLLAVRRQHLLAARSFGASLKLQARDVVLPSALPASMYGLRTGLGIGWFCVVAAEMMGAQSGLGFGINLYGLNLQLANVVGYILVTGVIGLSLDFGLGALDRRLNAWYHVAIRYAV